MDCGGRDADRSAPAGGDEAYMRLALDLARRGRGRTSPNPMVGAVVVRDGRVVGRGFHERAGGPHAEVVALREAGEAARGATLYVSLEPCCHVGRTGPCTEAILEAGVARVVAAMKDPNPLVSGRGLERLRQAGVEVAVGVLEREAARLNEAFCKYITTRLPFVILKVAMTLDGKIATRTGASRWITGPEARAYVHTLRDTCDAVLVGIGTVLADDPALTVRLPAGGRDPVRVVLDSRARLPVGARVLTGGSPAPTVVAVTEEAPAERIRRLEEAGARVLVLPARDGRVSLPALLEELGRREITSVLVEGGATVHAAALAAGLVDRVVWFVAPKIFGGRDAPGPVAGPGVADPAAALTLEEVEVTRYGPDVCIEGYVRGRLPV